MRFLYYSHKFCERAVIVDVQYSQLYSLITLFHLTQQFRGDGGGAVCNEEKAKRTLTREETLQMLQLKTEQTIEEIYIFICFPIIVIS